jgi:hypothetical protein
MRVLCYELKNKQECGEIYHEQVVEKRFEHHNREWLQLMHEMAVAGLPHHMCVYAQFVWHNLESCASPPPLHVPWLLKCASAFLRSCVSAGWVDLNP